METSFETALSWAANLLQVLGTVYALKTWHIVRMAVIRVPCTREELDQFEL